MNKILGLIFIFLIIFSGLAVYFFETKAQQGHISLNIANIGDGRNLLLSWTNPKREYQSLEIYASPNQEEDGNLVATIPSFQPGQKMIHLISVANEGQKSFITIYALNRHQKILLTKEMAIAKKMANTISYIDKDEIKVIDENYNLLSKFKHGYGSEIEFSIINLDIDSSGQDEIITFPKLGNDTINIFNANGALLHSFQPFGPKFGQGMSIAILDYEKKIVAISSLTPPAKPIKIFQIKNTPEVIKEIDLSEYGDGYEVFSAQFNGNGQKELVISFFSLAPNFLVYDLDLEQVIGHIYPYSKIDSAKISIEVNDIDSDGGEELIVYPLGNRTSIIKTFTCCSILEIDSFQPYADEFKDKIDLVAHEKGLAIVRSHDKSAEIKFFSFDSGYKFQKEIVLNEQGFDGTVEISKYHFKTIIDPVLVAFLNDPNPFDFKMVDWNTKTIIK